MQLYLPGKLKPNVFFYVAILCLTFIHAAFAQQGKNAVRIGSTEAFAQNFLNNKALINAGSLIIPTTESQLPVAIHVVTKEGIRGKIQGYSTSNVFIDYINGKIQGKVIIPDEKKAYNYFSDDKGNILVESVDINKVMCIDMYTTPVEPVVQSDYKASSDTIPQLESLPGATAVVYLDFDGQIVSGGYWNGGDTIDAAPAGLTTEQMLNAWYLTSEDYRPYKLNITTKESVYLAAPIDKRMRCIITPTNTALPKAGGVSLVGSFSAGDPDNSPCWVFNLYGTGHTTGETCSHEIGHTMGLAHDGLTDGTQYYMGNTLWAPIMGNSYTKAMSQWSKGEYTDANNTENDVAIIGGLNGFGFRADEAGNTIEGASVLKIEADKATVLASKNYGIISKSSDIDVYSFNTGAGNVSFTVNPSAHFPDLDILLSITDGSGKILAADSSTMALSAEIITTLPAGTFYLQIDGTNNGTGSDGYTDYASLGEYSIQGKVVPYVITALNKPEAGSKMPVIHPNPAAEQLNVKLNSPGVISTISIVNMLGQTTYTLQSDEQSLIINLSTYNKGIYFITVNNTSGTTTTKFIKE
jgi:hypothetical protein